MYNIDSFNDSIEHIRLLEKFIFCVYKFRKINNRVKDELERLHLLMNTIINKN